MGRGNSCSLPLKKTFCASHRGDDPLPPSLAVLKCAQEKRNYAAPRRVQNCHRKSQGVGKKRTKKAAERSPKLSAAKPSARRRPRREQPNRSPPARPRRGSAKGTVNPAGMGQRSREPPGQEAPWPWPCTSPVSCFPPLHSPQPAPQPGRIRLLFFFK